MTAGLLIGALLIGVACTTVFELTVGQTIGVLILILFVMRLMLPRAWP
jgi:hypothetical protein